MAEPPENKSFLKEAASENECVFTVFSSEYSTRRWVGDVFNIKDKNIQYEIYNKEQDKCVGLEEDDEYVCLSCKEVQHIPRKRSKLTNFNYTESIWNTRRNDLQTSQKYRVKIKYTTIYGIMTDISIGRVLISNR